MPVRITLRYSELADTYFWLRAPCDGGPADPLRHRVSAVFKPLPRYASMILDPLMASQPGDPHAVHSSLAAAGEDEVARLEAVVAPYLGAPLRELVTELSGCLAAAPAPPPTRRADVTAAIAGLDVAGLESATAAVSAALGLGPAAGTEPAIGVTLVADGIALGGVTGELQNGQPACFAAVRGYCGSTLAELIVHEATHALDILSPLQDSLVERLRAEPGADQQLWHATLFLAAAAAVREHIAAGHQDFGSTHGYYAKIPAVLRELRARGIADQLSPQPHGLREE